MTAETTNFRELFQRSLGKISELKAQLVSLEAASNEPVAIVGMACRWPGKISDPASYWRSLCAGVDAVVRFPEARGFPDERLPTDPGEVRWAGLMEGVDLFDAEFFGISPREAAGLDPQHRILLEVAWEALENAGLPAGALLGARAGVFVGISSADYGALFIGNDLPAAFDGTGSLLSAAAGRISYKLGLQGPAMAVDTACSSSLVSVHLACQSLRRRESDLALAGGVNAVLEPRGMAMAVGMGGLAPDGRCKTFDARANGYVRGEGCGLVVLKRLSDARRDGDRISAVILGSAVNQDGRSTGLTVPNVLAQQALLREALANAGVSARDIGYVETHGTGTSLGDPIELEALRAVLGAPRPGGLPCVLGAVKTNLGHTEAAAGVAGLMKAVLCLENKRIPRNLHFETLNPRMSLEGTPFIVPVEEQDFSASEGPRRAGVSSFGISGTNAHLILQEAEAGAPSQGAAPDEFRVLSLSARSASALAALAGAYARYLVETNEPFIDIAYTASCRRSHLEHRLAVVGKSATEVARALEELAAGESPAGVFQGKAEGAAPQVVLVFAGQGSQWMGMGKELLQHSPVFRGAVEACARAISAAGGVSLLDELYGAESEARFARADVAQPALFAMQVGLLSELRARGVEPSCVIGQSVGEVAAAYAAGAIDLETACRVVVERARAVLGHAGRGKMVAVEMPDAEAAVNAALSEETSRCSVAALNGPRSLVLSGEPSALDRVIEKLVALGADCKELRVDYASHSPLMDEAERAFLRAVGDVPCKPGSVKMISTVTGKEINGAALSASYWGRNLRLPVRFTHALAEAMRVSHRVFVELGPHPLLTADIGEQLAAAGYRGSVIPTLRRNKDERELFKHALAALHTRGVRVRWAADFLAPGRVVVLPNNPWQRERYWLKANPRAMSARQGSPTGHPLLGARLLAAGHRAVYESVVSIAALPYLADHRVFAQVLVPGAALLELSRAAVDAALGEAASGQITGLAIRTPLILPSEGGLRVQVVVAEAGDEAPDFTVTIFSQPLSSKTDAGWTEHASARSGSRPLEEAPARVDISAVRARCARAIDVAALYERLQAIGIEYGPMFRGISELYGGRGEALARIELPEGAAEQAAAYGIHPALLDAAFQAIAGTFDAESSEQAYLPLEVGSFVVYKRGASSVLAHATVEVPAEQEPELLSADVVLLDEQGEAVAAARGMRFKRAGEGAAVRGKAGLAAHWLYELTWQDQPLTAAGRRVEGPVLILHEGDEISGHLSAHLRERGATCQEIDLNGPTATVDDGLRRALHAGPAEVVLIWDPTPSEARSQADRAEAACVTALAVVKALIEDGAAATRLSVITRGAMATGPADWVDPAAASLWGFFRSVAQERPELSCRLIDIEASAPSAGLVAELGRELRAGDDEAQIAWRGSRRLGARLARARLPHSDATRIIEPRATVLITGGLGGLGLYTARWLFEEHHVAHLLLVSRSEPSEAQRAEIAALCARGARVSVASADVSDKASLERTLASVPADLPLRGVMHCAGVLDDRVLTEQTPERLARVFAPKVFGASHLDELTRGLDLDLFVLYSSTAALLGSPGQSNHAAANAFLDGLAFHRRRSGLPCTSINHGPWGQAGKAHELPELARQRLRRAGVGYIEPSEGLSLMGSALEHRFVQLALLNLDTAALSRALGANIPPLFRGILRADLTRPAEPFTRKGTDWRALPESGRKAGLLRLLQREAAKVLSLPADRALSPEQPLRDLGLDSLLAVELRNTLSKRLGVALPATLLFDQPALSPLADFLLRKLASPDAKPTAAPAPAATHLDGSEIAIVAMACRAPSGVSTPEQLWDLIADGRDAIGAFPSDRGWNVDALYDPEPGTPGKTYSRSGGFLSDLDLFDAAFFGISPKEAECLDPQQRLLLEVAWEALERAGIPATSLAGSKTGVFVGMWGSGYLSQVAQRLEQLNGYAGSGNAPSTASGRIAYTFGLQGPALTIDTACSSSLVALHLGVQSLRRGESDLVLSGGVTVMMSPAGFVEFSQLRGLAPDGRCKAFSDRADGTGWSEGCGLLVLERLADARRLGHPVLALVRGSAINQDGRSQGLTAPNGPAQERVIEDALRDARLRAEQVDAVEAHGTGTSLGDPIEAQALLRTYGEAHTKERPLWLGSLKSNVGHTQAAAGVLGVIKMVLALKHERLPRTLHASPPSRHVDWELSHVALLEEPCPWPRGASPRRAAVSSFGVSGTNAHVVLEEAPDAPASTSAAPREGLGADIAPLLLSVDRPAAQRAQARQLAEVLRRAPDIALQDVAFTLARGRASLPYRAAVLAKDAGQALAQLQALAEGEPLEDTITGQAGGLESIVLVFPGQGGHWIGLGRELYRDVPVFARAIDDVAAALAPYIGFSLLEVLLAEPEEQQARFARTSILQPFSFAVSIALAKTWQWLGVEPAAVVGHSQGEIAAAYFCGALELSEAARIVATRARLIEEIAPPGSMATVGLGGEEVAARIARYGARISVAVRNSEQSTGVAGEPAAVAELLAELRAQGVFCREIDVAYASHAVQIDAVLEPLSQALADISPRPTRLPFVSSVEGREVEGEALGGAYWARNLRQTVRFDLALGALAGMGSRVFLELSGHPQLLLAAQESISGAAVGSLRRGDGGKRRLLRSATELWAHGARVDLGALVPQGARCDLPTYPFQRERHWIDAPTLGGSGGPSRYAVSWQRAELPSGPPNLAGAWVVVAGPVGAPLAERLGTALREAGAEVLFLGVDLPLLRVKMETLLAEGFSRFSSRPRGVISLLALEEGSPDEAAPAGLLGNLRVCQAISCLAEGPALWLLTRGAVECVERDTVPRPAQATTWGLGLTFSLEQARRWGGLVDLPEQAPDMAVLTRILGAARADHEDQTALRGGERWVRRLSHDQARADRGGTPSPWPLRGAALITGGTGGLGAELARHLLVQHGVRDLLLVSRHGIEAEGAADLQAELVARGGRPKIAACDLASPADVAALIAEVEAEGPKITAVFHTAGVSHAIAISSLTEEALAHELGGKLTGARVLHDRFQDHQLDAFVLYGSCAGVWGGSAEGAYAAGNAYLDALARHRRARGLPALAVSWGPWAGAGMASPAEAQKQLSRRGLKPMTPKLALTALDEAQQLGLSSVAIAGMDWGRFAPAYAFERPRPLLDLLPEAQHALRDTAEPGPGKVDVEAGSALLDTLKGLSGTERRRTLHGRLQQIVAQVLGLSVDGEIDLDKPFRDFGLDSLMALTARNRIGALLGMKLPATLLFEHGTIRGLGRHLLASRLGFDDVEAMAPAPAAPRRRSEDGWVVITRPNPSARLRLIAFPYAGGGASVYRDWAEDLGPDIELLVVQPPGRQERAGEPPAMSVLELAHGAARALVPYLDKPFAFFGHCLGAIVAYEVTRILRAERGLSPAHLFASGALPPHRYMVAPMSETQTQDDIIEMLRFIGFASPEVLADREALPALLVPFRQDMKLAAEYAYEPSGPLDIPIMTFAARDDWFGPPELVDWRAYTTARYHHMTYAGDHYFINPERGAISRVIREEIATYLAVFHRRASAFDVASVVRPHPRPAASVYLLVCPGPGRSAAVYERLAAALPGEIEVGVVELPGRGARAGEEPYRRVSDMVDMVSAALERRTDRRLAFLGHSLGAIVLFDLARRSGASSGAGPEHLFVSGAMSPQDYCFTPLHFAPRDKLLRGLRQAGIIEGQSASTEEAWRADLAAMCTYEYVASPPLDIPITAMVGDQDAANPRVSLARWRDQTQAPFTQRSFPGGHGFLEAAPAACVDFIASQLLAPTARSVASARR